jgi:ABC-type Co2+ transport system permease subunit
MTHVMVPDGVFPLWLSAAGWIVAIVLLALAMWHLRREPRAQMVPLVGVMAALMFVVMSIELVPIGYELHLTVLTGIILGPWYGAIAALLFNILRALIGDGAFTNIGLNTGITWTEIALGSAIFAAMRPLAQRRPGVAAAAATFVSLFVATVVFLGVVRVSTLSPTALVETGAYNVEEGGFAGGPFARGVLNVRLTESQEAGERGGAPDAGGATFFRFAVVVLALGFVGWAIEAVVTAAIVAFLARVRPALLGLRPSPVGADVQVPPAGPSGPVTPVTPV